MGETERFDREKRVKRVSGHQDKSWRNTQGVIPGGSEPRYVCITILVLL